MPGRPMQTRVIATLAARAMRSLGDDATALDYTADYIANGKTIADLAADLAAEWGEPVSRQLVSQAVHALPDATTRIEAARKDSALAIAEGTITLTDDVEPTPGAAAKGRLQLSARQWLATALDPARFGTKGPTLQINVGALLLDALRQPMPLYATATPILLEGSSDSESSA